MKHPVDVVEKSIFPSCYSPGVLFSHFRFPNARKVDCQREFMGFRCKNVLDDECKDDGRCHRTMTVRSLGMCTCKVTNVCWCFAVAALLLGAVSVQGERELGLKILYSETPLNITSKTNAVFAFNVVGGNGTNPCAVQRCSIKCKVS